ncbi:MAG: DUF4893 domain-containing protein [Parvibaculaceae bacterium]|nr:DUF4893 domain-containing protein [Parvibaculaceae bacterium]
MMMKRTPTGAHWLPMNAFVLTVSLIVASMAAPAYAEEGGLPLEYNWQNVITQADKERLAKLDEAVAQGTEESYTTGASISQRAALHKIMSPPATRIKDQDLMGWWGCRTIKVGGPIAGLIVYPFFDCRVRVIDGFMFLEKRSGSQRLSGRLYHKDATTRVLLAAPTYNDEPQRVYSGPEGGITDPQKQDKLGVLSMLEDGRVRIVFPYPVLESTFDVLEMRRPETLHP